MLREEDSKKTIHRHISKSKKGLGYSNKKIKIQFIIRNINEKNTNHN